MSTPTLELFKFDSCPFCLRVMDKIEELGLKVTYRDIMTNGEDRRRLQDDTGRQTVPCLYIDDKPLFESTDILNWLNKNQQLLEKA